MRAQRIPVGVHTPSPQHGQGCVADALPPHHPAPGPGPQRCAGPRPPPPRVLLLLVREAAHRGRARNRRRHDPRVSVGPTRPGAGGGQRGPGGHVGGGSVACGRPPERSQGADGSCGRRGRNPRERGHGRRGSIACRRPLDPGQRSGGHCSHRCRSRHDEGAGDCRGRSAPPRGPGAGAAAVRQLQRSRCADVHLLLLLPRPLPPPPPLPMPMPMPMPRLLSSADCRRRTPSPTFASDPQHLG